MPAPFEDRFQAGSALAAKLGAYAHRDEVMVLALPRGGVPIGFQVARALVAPLDVFLVRKLGVPRHEELAMGAMASGGTVVLNEDVIRTYDVSPDSLERVRAAEQQVLERRERIYRDDRPRPEVRGRTVILVDDGLATGATMLAAIKALRQQEPARIVVGVPVGAPETCEFVRGYADEVVCVQAPEVFYAVGMWYVDFSPVTDAEVRDLLERAEHEYADAHQGKAAQ